MVGSDLLENDRKRYADDITLQEFVRLRVENERLREALIKIADYETEEDCPCAACEHATIARSALQQKESE